MVPPRGGHYPISIVSLSLRLVLQAGASLRGAAAALALFVEQGFASFAVPCFSTIRSWLLRVGCYALSRPLDRTAPWVWLIDHTIQIGSLKLLVILGCPLAQVPFGERASQLADWQLVALAPMEKSNGALVEAELEKAIERTGAPAQIVSDQGSDLLKGIADFQGWYPRVVHVPDVAHYGANVLENAWGDQSRWQQFMRDLQNVAAKLRQTPAAYLLPPHQRPKARFMNIGVQLRFARRVLKLLDRPKPHEKAEEVYGWLRDYRDDLAVWEREHALVRTTIETVRLQGLHSQTAPQLEAVWGELGTQESTVRIAEQLRDYATRYQPTIEGTRLVASTEVLESCFGKLKRLERDQSRDGITGLALALGAIAGPSSDADLKEALDTVPQKKVDGWIERNISITMQWLRRQFFQQTKA
jgi:hypothetical protein